MAFFVVGAHFFVGIHEAFLSSLHYQRVLMFAVRQSIVCGFGSWSKPPFLNPLALFKHVSQTPVNDDIPNCFRRCVGSMFRNLPVYERPIGALFIILVVHAENGIYCIFCRISSGSWVSSSELLMVN